MAGAPVAFLQWPCQFSARAGASVPLGRRGAETRQFLAGPGGVLPGPALYMDGRACVLMATGAPEPPVQTFGLSSTDVDARAGAARFGGSRSRKNFATFLFWHTACYLAPEAMEYGPMAPKNRHLILTAAFLTAGSVVPASAQQFQDLAAMERRIVIALGADIGEPGGPTAPIDRRLRLAPCPQPVTVEPAVLGAATVRCVPLNWRIRVPLVRNPNAAAASAPARVPAPARNRATAPVETAVVETPMPTSRPQRAEPVVRRGQPVSMIVMASGFTVTRPGVADQDGAVGDTIRIRTDRNTTPIVGQVQPDGRILLPGFN